MKKNMFNKKSIFYFLILLLVLIVGLGVSSAADIDTNSWEVEDNSTDLNLTTIPNLASVSLENNLDNQILISDSGEEDSSSVSHSHKSLSSINKVPAYLQDDFDLVTSIHVDKQISNYLNYTVKVTDDSIIDATGPVTVTITIPSNLTIVSTLPPGATFSSGVITWTISSMLSGDNATLNFIANVSEEGFINVTATATPDPDDTEIDSSNNYAESTMDAITYLSFTALRDFIEANKNLPYIILDNNYAYDYIVDGDKFGFTAGVEISTPVYLLNNGGYIISGANRSKIFNITADGVTIDGLILTNGWSNRGSAITSYANNLRVTRSTFIENLINGDAGGAIYIGGNYTIIEHSTFINNTASSEGGAIGMIGVHDVNITNSTFDNNFVSSPSLPGGAISINNSNTIKVNYNAIVNNRGRTNGFAVFVSVPSNWYNIDLNYNWWGTNYPDFSNNRLIQSASTYKPTRWVILQYDIVSGSMTLANTHASWYTNTTTGVVSKLNIGLPSRSISFGTNHSYFLSPDTEISSDTYAAYFYGTTVPDQIFYINTTVDSQTCVIEFTTLLNITKTVESNVSVAGDNYQYNITIINYGPNTAYNVNITDYLPSSVTINDTTGPVNGTILSGNIVSWGIPAIPAGTNYTVPLVVKSNSAGTNTNRANMSSTNKYNYILNNIAYANHTIIPGVDLNITVVYSNASYINEPNYYFDIYVTNLGPSTANGVEVYFKVPNGMEYVAPYNSYGWGSYDNATGIWTGLGSIASGATRHLRIQANATQAGIFNSTANVTLTSSSTVNETKLYNNEFNVSVYVSDNIDLNISLSANVTELLYKSQVNLTVTVRNFGPAPANNISVKIDLPSGLTYVSDNSTGLYNSTTGIWNISYLARNQQASIYIICNADVLGNFTINATVYNSSDENDTNLTNNYDELNLTVIPHADLSVLINVTNSTPGYDSQSMRNITYTITVYNGGLNNATNVTVNFTLPGTLIYLDHTSGLTYNSTSGIWEVGDVLVNETKEINITVGINSTGIMIVFANVTGNENDTFIANNTANLTINVTNLVDLSINKTVNITGVLEGSDIVYYADEGDNVTYTLIITNNGPNNATNVVVTDFITNLTNIVANASGVYNGITKNITWTIANLGAGETVYLHFNATILCVESTLFNNASVGSNDNDLNISNNVDNITLIINHYADLEIILNISNSTPAFNDLVNLTVTVINHGPSIAFDTNVTLEIPTDLEWRNDNSSGAYDKNSKVWTIGTLGIGNSTSIWILLNVTSIGNMTINGTVNSTINDTNLTNNFANVSISSFASNDLRITIGTNITGAIYMEDPFTIFVTVSNYGPSNATDVNVTFEIPAGLTLIGENSSGAYVVSTGIWTIGNLNVGETRSLHFNVTSNTAKVFNINATVNGSENDRNLSNNYANVTVDITPVFDLVIRVTPNFTKARVGDEISLTVNVTNYGPSNATNVVVSSVYSSSFTGAPSSWSIGNISVGESKIFVVKVNATVLGSYDFLFSVNAPGNDSNKSNNNDTVKVNITTEVDLLISVTVDNSTPSVWGNVTYTITVSNLIRANATGVYINIPLPSGLTYLDKYEASGFYNESTGVWYIGDLDEGNSTSLILTCRVVSPGTIVLGGTVDSLEFDLDSSNNYDEATIVAVDAPLDDSVDLELHITVDNPNIHVGEKAVFTFNLTNKGPLNATNVQVSIDIPTGLSDINALPETGTNYVPVNSTNSLWIVGNLNVGESVILNISAKPNVLDNITISGNASSNEVEFNLTDNYANLTILPDVAADLVVNITANPLRPFMDDLVVFTISLTNIGLTSVTGATVYVDLPASSDANSSVGFFTPVSPYGCGVWLLSGITINPGQVETLNISLNTSVMGFGNHTYKVNVTSGVYDIDSDNDKDNVTVEVRSPSDLIVTITANVTEVFTGENIKFTVTVYNAGAGDADDVFVYLNFPSSVDYTGTKGLFDTNKSIWSVGTLAPSETQTLNVIFSLIYPGNYTFYANGTTTSLDTNLTNNNDTWNITVKPDYDLVVSIIANPENISLGGSVTFTVTVNNTGLTTAENVKVYLDFYTSATVSYITPGTSYNGVAGFWDIGSVSTGQEFTLNLTYDPAVIGTYTFNASVNGTGSERNKDNNNDSVTINVANYVDLIVNITVNNETPSLGSNVVYTVTVRNNGTNTANMIVLDTSLRGTASGYNPFTTFPTTTGIVFIISLAPGASETIQYTVPVTKGGLITETVNVTCNEADYNMTNNYANVTINASTATDVNITILVSNSTPYVSDIVNFTIIVENIGAVNASDVIVQTNITTPITYSGSDGLYNPNKGLWRISNLANGTQAILNLSVNISTLGFSEYFASVNISNEEIDLSNNNATVNLTSSPLVDLEVIILANTTFYTGNTTTFTVFVMNNGPSDATGVTVTLDIPEDSSSTVKGTYSSGVWNVNTLTAGENATLTLTRTLTLSDNGIFTANITGTEFEYNTTNNNDSINLTVYAITDLAVVIETTKASYVYGENVIYIVTVINNGPTSISNANVSISLPNPVNITQNLTTNGYYNETDSVWYLTNTLNPNTNVSLTIQFNTSNTGYITAVASVISDVYENYLDNNTNNVTYYIEPAADVYINITTIPTIFNTDGSVGFIVTVGNLGPCDAVNASVNLSFPLTTSYSPSAGYYDAIKSVWFIPTLAYGQVETLLVNVNLTNFTQIFNGNISTDVYDPNMTNNYASINLTVSPLANLEVTITADKLNVSVGDVIRFTINATNLGPCIAQGVEVYVNLTASEDFERTLGLFDTDNGKWQIGEILPGTSEYLYVNVTFNTSGVFTFVTNITGDVNDTVTINNNDTITVTVNPSTDIQVIITSNFTEAIPGDSVEFNITVINAGDNNDTNVVVKLVFPSEISTPNIQNYGVGTLTGTFPNFDTWTIPTLDAGENKTLTIKTTLLSNGTFNFTAYANGTLKDSNLTNNIASLIYNVTPVVDLKITLNSTNTSQYLSENVTFTVIVENIGTNTANNVIVSLDIPKGSSSKTQGVFDGDTGVWYIGDLASGSTVELNITILNTVNSIVTYTAKVNSSSKDLDESNNNDSFTFTGLNSTDLILTVSLNDYKPYVNDIINYTFTLVNNGLTNAENVNISTNLTLNGFEFIASDSGYNSATGLWTVGTLSPGEVKTLTVTYKTNNSGVFTNVFNASLDTYDINLTNNIASLTVNVSGERGNVDLVDLIISLTVSNATPCVNSTVEFNITVLNNAGITAHDIVITNYLPGTFVPVSGYGNWSTGVWNFTELAPGASVTVSFVANVTDVYGSYVNNVTVYSKELDSVPINNQANVLIILSEAELDCIDLEINVTRVSSNLTINGSITYNITIANYGPDMAFDVNSSVNLNNGVGLVIDNWTVDVGTFNPSTGIWSAGDLDVTNLTATHIITMLLKVNITDAGYYVNHWSVWDDDVDLNPLNNNALDIFWVNETLVDIGVRIHANTTAPTVNDTVLFEITVYNSGTLPATNVTVNLTLPSNVINVTSSDSAFNNTTNSFYVGDLAVGAKVVYHFTGIINSTDSAVFTVVVNGTEEDRYLESNIDSVTINAQEPSEYLFADIELVNFDPSTTRPVVDNFMTFFGTVRNNGPDIAHNVVVSLTLPSGVIITQGSSGVNINTATVNAGTLNPGDFFQFDLKLNITTDDIIMITAAASSDELDTNASNNVKSVGLAPYVLKPDIDLSVSVSVSEFAVNVNDNVTFTITVVNNGNENANNITIKNILSDGLVVDNVSDGVYYTGDGWKINSIMGKGSKSFTVTCNVTDTGVLLLTSKVNCSEDDLDPTNNAETGAIYASVPPENPTEINTTLTLTVPTAGLGANKKVRLDTGDKIAYAILKDENGNLLSGYNVKLTCTASGKPTVILQNATDSNGRVEFILNKDSFDNEKYDFVASFTGKVVNGDKYLECNSTVQTWNVKKS